MSSQVHSLHFTSGRIVATEITLIFLQAHSNNFGVTEEGL